MLNTKIGNIELKKCIFNASGVYCKTYNELLILDESNSGAIISKSCTKESREGNPYPIYWDDGKHISINSSGLPNMGYKYYINSEKSNFSKPYFVSISGLCEQDNLDIISELLVNDFISGIELNLSCPNIIGKSQIGYDFNSMDILLGKVNNLISSKTNRYRFNFGIKLPPYFDEAHFKKVSDIINKYEIDTITCINSLGNGLIVNSDTESVVIKPKNGFGGIGGKVIKSIALANVRKFSELTNCDIIGCGGISTGTDIFEHILCGAKAVQVGTQFYMEGIDVFKRLENELIEIMKNKGYNKISDFCGKLKSI